MTAANASGVTRGHDENVAAPVIGKWLRLAAAPTFIVMALITAGSDGSAPMALCSGADGFAPGGMAPMYLLMALFHLTPWLKLVSRRHV